MFKIYIIKMMNYFIYGKRFFHSFSAALPHSGFPSGPSTPKFLEYGNVVIFSKPYVSIIFSHQSSHFLLFKILFSAVFYTFYIKII